jgi:rhodanese-related sulfurtransferase
MTMKPLKLLTILCALFVGIPLMRAQTEVHSLLPIAFEVMARKTNGVIIDVRNKEEYDFAHIQNAIQIGVESGNFLTQIRSLEKSKNYFVYCGIGKRSDVAIRIMQTEGFKNVYGLKGGFIAWKKEKLPVVKYQQINKGSK